MSFVLTQLGWTADNIADMVTTDFKTVTEHCQGDFAPSFVLNVIAARSASIVDVETVMANAVDADMGHAWITRNSASTGPFLRQTYRPAEILTLQANPDHCQGVPKMVRAVIQHGHEGASQRLQPEARDVDMAKPLDPGQITVRQYAVTVMVLRRGSQTASRLGVCLDAQFQQEAMPAFIKRKDQAVCLGPFG